MMTGWLREFLHDWAETYATQDERLRDATVAEDLSLDEKDPLP